MKVGNYILSPALHSIFIDMACNTTARKAYLSLLMLLPINKYTITLKNKIDNLEDYPILFPSSTLSKPPTNNSRYN